MIDLIGSLFDDNKKILKKIDKKAVAVMNLDSQMSELTDDELKAKTVEFKERFIAGETLDDLMIEAFAVVREAAWRVLGMKHFKVQIMGGIALHGGNIAEMKTGEGKTLVGTLPAYLNAIEGKGVFIITVNDYLAQRDRQEMGQVFEWLGLNVGLIERQMQPAQKKEAYAADITYGTNSEFGFDYLRDNMAVVKNNVAQRGLNFAIIDEVDSILIDEARTPLIISGTGNIPSQFYITVDNFVKSLKAEDDYEVDHEKKSVELTESGMDKTEKIFNLEDFSSEKNVELLHHIRQSLVANYVYKKDREYVVQDGEILIVDQFTGRLMPGRRFSNGLHQAIEAKEGTKVQKESKNLATISYQNLFKLFNKLSGMTGTATSEAGELSSIYGMGVVSIPTNRPMIRKDEEDWIYSTKKGKFNAIVDEVRAAHEIGQPVLVGTIFIDDSEVLSKYLKKAGISHKLLNAKQNKEEAEIIALAGQKGSVTIATNMAGRGTDIKLGEGAAEAGGLYVIGSEKHDSVRIDSQLRGRSGRQGDAGKSRFFASLEDKLFDHFDEERLESVKKVIEKSGATEDERLIGKTFQKAIDSAQNNVNSMYKRVRENTLKYDGILSQQRRVIYDERDKILNSEDMSEFIQSTIANSVEIGLKQIIGLEKFPENWDLKELEYFIKTEMGLDIEYDLTKLEPDEVEELDLEKLVAFYEAEGLRIYAEREEAITPIKMRFVERLILMRTLDNLWMEHIDIVEQMKQGVMMQYIGVRDPLDEYNKEAYEMFEETMRRIKVDTLKKIFELKSTEETEAVKIEKIKANQSDEDKAKRLELLEEKFKLEQKQLQRIPNNVAEIPFDVDINATQSLDITSRLYYLGDGLEERLSEFDESQTIDGVFKVSLKATNDTLWAIGWYQVRVYVIGQLAKSIDFYIEDAKVLAELQEKAATKRDTEQKSAQPIQFLPNNKEQVNFDLNVGENIVSIKAHLFVNKRLQQSFEVPVQSGKCRIEMKRPENGWMKGMVNLLLELSEENRMDIPLMFVDVYSASEPALNLGIQMKIEGDGDVDLIGQLVDISQQKVVLQFPIKASALTKGSLTLNSEKGFAKGVYEMKLAQGQKIIYAKQFMIQ